MFDTYHEHMDHETGAFANEFQAAFDLSHREASIEGSVSQNEIAQVVAAGRFAVAHNYLTYCRFTDATLGSKATLAAAFDTREEAEAYVEAQPIEGGDDTWFTILPAPVYVAPAYDPTEDECPF